MRKIFVTGLFLALGTPPAFADAADDCSKMSGDAGIFACDTAIRNDPTSAVNFHNRGNIYYNKGDVDRAFADYNRSIELNPKDAAPYVGRGNVYFVKGETDRALAEYNRSIELDPKLALAYRNRGLFYRNNKKDDDRALADYSKAIELDPKLTVAYNDRAEVYRDSGDTERALAEYRKSIELDPIQPDVYSNRGAIYRNKGEYGRAVNEFYASTLIAPDNFVYAWQLGLVQFDRGGFKAASVSFLRAIELKDDPYTMLFRYLARSRENEQAGAELEANAGRLKTKEWPFAAIELYLGKRSPAATLDAAVKPDSTCEAQFYIGQWQVLKGDKSAAEAALKIAADTCPKDFTEYSSAVAELKRLKR